jgi:hypothetical protein
MFTPADDANDEFVFEKKTRSCCSKAKGASCPNQPDGSGSLFFVQPTDDSVMSYEDTFNEANPDWGWCTVCGVKTVSGGVPCECPPNFDGDRCGTEHHITVSVGIGIGIVVVCVLMSLVILFGGVARKATQLSDWCRGQVQCCLHRDDPTRVTRMH